MTADYVRVGRVEDFAPGVIRAFQEDGLDVAVVSWRDRFYAFNNHCTHMGFPLDESGYISPDNEVICTSHFSCYDLETGRQTDGPGYSGLPVYDVKVEEGEVLVARTPRAG
ncbi:MAG TPA: Rieske (2Fe-2S) protein [Dehalococcoidia bacterium]|nr:Rieske (2Fe-2S) protein [Dehalococcoidia bacterium]